MTSLPRRLLPALLSGLVALAVPVAATGAPYEPVAMPHVQRDGAGDARVSERSLARTDLTRREARAADFTEVRYAVVDHDGEPSAQVSVRFRRALPDRPRRHTQRVQVFFDEESLLEATLGDDDARYRSSFGGKVSQEPGCTRLDASTDGAVVTAWVPVRCLLTDTSEMNVRTTVEGRAPGTASGRRVVGTDSALRTVPLVRWR